MAPSLLTLLAAVALGPPNRSPPPGGVPAVLTEVNPVLALRWRTVALDSDGPGAAGTLAPGKTTVARLESSPILRLRGRFARGCDPLVRRRFSSPGGRLDVPLPPPSPSGEDRVVVLPPALAPGPPRQGEPVPVTLALTLPAGCAPTPVRAYEPGEDPDPYAGLMASDELGRLLEHDRDDETWARWLAVPHPHRWQDEAALAVALPRLLGGGEPARLLARALLAQATAGLRTKESSFTMLSDLVVGPAMRVRGADGSWMALAAGGQVELDVAGQETIRISHRGSATDDDGAPLAWRLAAGFDDEPPLTLLGRAPIDPDAPDSARSRVRAFTVPPGARRLRLRALDGPVMLWVAAAHAKGWFGNLFAHGPAALLEAASRARGPAAALAALALRRAPLPADVEATSQAPLPAALLGLMQAERTGDPDEAEAWLRLASKNLGRASTPLERAAAVLVDARITRVRAERAVAAGNPGEAADLLLALAARRPLCDEDAEALLDADAFAGTSPSASPQALLAVDGLLATRPLDRGLALAREQAFRGATRWQELSNDPGPREVHFLDPPPDGEIGPQGPEHGRFVALDARTPRVVELSEPPLAGQVPLLALVAMRPPGAPPVVRVRIDDDLVAVPALGPLERVDVPARPGRHQVTVDAGAGATQVLVNWAVGGGEGRRWRRYLELGAVPVALNDREVAAGDLLLLSLRVLGPGGGARGPLRVVLSGDTMTPLALPLEPGAASTGAPGEVDRDVAVSESVEALVSVASRNASFRLSVQGAPPGVRVLAHLAVRRRAPVPPASPAEPAAAGPKRGGMLAVAELTHRITRLARAGNDLLLARAAALAGVDEATLAREDLVRLFQARPDPASRKRALALWRHLDDVSGSYPQTVDERAAAARVPGPVPVDARALSRLLDAPAALRRLDPAALVRAGGDLALTAAARQAERDGAAARAAELWQRLASEHPRADFYLRVGRALLLLPPDPLRDIDAYLALSEAVRLDPFDSVASRLLQRAAVRTRLRPVREVDDSAGTVSIDSGGANPSDTSAEAALAPAGTGELVTRDRQLSLSFDLPAPMAVRLAALVRELRPAGARAIGAPPIALSWMKDGEAIHDVACPGADAGFCRSGAIALPAGAHTLVARVQGGLQPAARVTIEPASCPPAPAACSRSPFAAKEDYLVARADRPVVVDLFGPAVVETEVRAPAYAAGRPVVLSASPVSRRRALTTGWDGGDLVRPPNAGGSWLAVGQLRESAPRVRRVFVLGHDPLPGTDDVSAVETLVLTRDQRYRLELRPVRGEVLCRLSLRDGLGTEAVPPPAPPAVLRAPGPAPLLTPPGVEDAVGARVQDGDVALGWDGFGALTAEIGWRTSVDVADTDQVISKSGELAALTYRQLIDPLGLTLKLGGESRVWQTGSPSQALTSQAYLMHPAARWMRVLGEVDAATQPIGGARATSFDGIVMLEPIATFASGIHLVNKLGFHWHGQSLDRVPDAVLPAIDPDVFSRYGASHPRALFWEEDLELEPLSDLLLFAGGRATSDPQYSLRPPDHLSATAVARTVLGRLFVEGSFRWSWAFDAPGRPSSYLTRTASLNLLHTVWIGHTQALMFTLELDEHIDQRVPEVLLRVGWEISNGRRLRDHTAVEGENYFYPQRGPGRESGRLLVGGLP